MSLAREGAELGIQGADIREANGVLVAVVDERDLGLSLDRGRTTDPCAIPLAVGEFGGDEIAAFGHEPGRDGDSLVVEGEVAHELLEGRDALRVEDLDRERKVGLRPHVAHDHVEVLGLERPVGVFLRGFCGLLGLCVVVFPDLQEYSLSEQHPGQWWNRLTLRFAALASAWWNE